MPSPRKKRILDASMVVAFALLGGTVAACSAILGIQSGNLESDGGVDATTDTGADSLPPVPETGPAESGMMDAGHMDATMPMEATTDAPKGDANDAATGCEARTVSDATGIYVALYGADNSSCGSRQAPCLTVGQGLAQAQLLGRSTVYVARGTYVESVTVGNGITIEGAWDTVSSTWVPICGIDELSAVTLQMPDSAGVVVTFGAGTTGGLHLLSVVGKAQPADPGESVYGVVATNATVTLDSVIINVGNGGDGVQGADGGTGAAGGTQCEAGAGTAGTPAGDAPPSALGTFESAGYAPTTGLEGASDGGPGTSGSCALSPSCVTICGTCQSICPSATSGCGGGPGAGGFGGQGGGSSVGVFGWNTQVTIVGGQVSAGNGGNGGNGGAGGPGGPGGAGDATQAVCMSFCNDAGCASVDDTTTAIANAGGAGGNGGHGGGGGGGFSYAVYGGGDAGVVVLQSSPALSHGDPGTGGQVHGPPGQAANQGP